MFRRLNNLGWNHHQEFDGLYDRAAKITGLDDGTLRQFASMADNFELLSRDNNLSYTHHKEVASIKPIIELRNGKLKLGEKPGEGSTGGMEVFLAAIRRPARRQGLAAVEAYHRFIKNGHEQPRVRKKCPSDGHLHGFS